MLKPYFILLLLSLFFFNVAVAQKRDTVVYYKTKAGKNVSTKDSADYFVVIMPPDTSVDKNLFVVNEFYSNGRTRLIGKSINNTFDNQFDLKFQGTVITFFSNGHKRSIGNFAGGQLSGDIINYYPNGKLYNIKEYISSNKAIFKQCNDSIGNTLTENGKGKWIDFYNESFDNTYVEGNVVDGNQEGEWIAKKNDSVVVVFNYTNSKVISSKVLNQKAYNQIFQIKTEPQFPGGLIKFAKFLEKNINYPAAALARGMQGRTIISFVVEKDGTLTNIRIAIGTYKDFDDEALRVMKLSPNWIPGTLNGEAVTVPYSVPIRFSHN